MEQRSSISRGLSPAFAIPCQSKQKKLTGMLLNDKITKDAYKGFNTYDKNKEGTSCQRQEQKHRHFHCRSSLGYENNNFSGKEDD